MTFDNIIDARVIMARLESEGIDCIWFDEHIVTSSSHFYIKVYEEDLEQATKIVEEINATPHIDEKGVEILCPKCNSADIYSGFTTLSDLKRVLAMITAFIFSILPIYHNRAYKCKSCNAEFKLRVKQ